MAQVDWEGYNLIYKQNKKMCKHQFVNCYRSTAVEYRCIICGKIVSDIDYLYNHSRTNDERQVMNG